MKLAFLADLHIANHRAHGGQVHAGVNYRGHLTLDALRRAVARAVELRCQSLFILGDVFDTVRPEPQLIAEVQRILDVQGLDVMVVEGNHDMVSTAPGDHSLGPLGVKAHVIDTPSIWDEKWVQVIAVPFEPGPATQWLPKRVDELLVGQKPSEHRLLVTHVGISDEDTESFMKATHDQVPASLLRGLCEKHGIKLVMAGNWHFHRVFDFGGSKAVQVGTLCPTGWDNPGVEGHGTMPVWDASSGQLAVETLPGPRFLNVPQERALRGLLGPESAALKGCAVFARVRADQPSQAQCGAQMQHLKDNGHLAAYEVELEDAEVRAQARTAATVARSAETLDAALTGYVEQMPLPDGVDRQLVLAKAKGFLAGGGK